ncbi:MAG: tetratricopeptide repeat protein, partial [Erythrobacter sp.]|nr:tetratricopeptide repeat protein [Erythrobacter sp.]
APDWLWAAIEDDIYGHLGTLGRLSYDAEVILGLCERALEDIAQGATDSTLSVWLRDAVAGNPERCDTIESAIRDPRIEGGLLPTAITVWQTLLESTSDQYRQADLWNNLSNHTGMLGNVLQALKASRESVKAIRRLTKSNPARYEPDLAASLNSLSVDLSASGDPQGALDAIREAVEIYRRLAAASPVRYEPDLARSV